MNTYSLLPVRSPKNFLICVIGLMTLLLATNTPAHHRPGHSGGPGGDDGGDPPAECNDLFPSFVYVREGGRNSADVTYLASKDGCRREPLPGVVGSTVHMTDVLGDGSVEGVIVWRENLNQDRIRRADFTVDSDGELIKLAIAPEPLPLEDTPVPDGDDLNYRSPDVWGDGKHDELYLVTVRRYRDNTTPNQESDVGLWIYDLNKLSDESVPIAEKKRELYQSDGDWFCPAGTINPEAVAECYRPETAKWNPAGTALYLQDTLYSWGGDPQIMSGERWNGAVRLQIERDPFDSLDSWVISPPEIVYTGATTNTGNEPGGLAARPRPEGFVCPTSSGHCDLILVSDDSNVTTTRRGMLDVEYCVWRFTPPATVGPEDWRNNECLVDSDPYTGESFDLGDTVGGTWHGGGSWQSPDDVLNVVREMRRHTSGFRTNIHDGVSTKLVDDARFLDTGM